MTTPIDDNGPPDEDEIQPRPRFSDRPQPLEGSLLPTTVPANPNDPRHHPNVLKAAEEIKAILKKYDLAAMMDIHGPRSSTFVRVIDPSWSCAFFEEMGDGGVCVRFRSKLKDYPSKEAQKACQAETAGMLIGFHRQALRDAEAMKVIIQMLNDHLEITSFDSPISGDSEGNLQS
jgi:hypothetical protein